MRDVGRLGYGATANDIPDVADPLDAGLLTADWAEYDPDSYRKAVREAVTGDELVEILFELAEGGSVEGWRGDIRERMAKKLHEQVDKGAEWVKRWEGKFGDDED